MRYRLRTLMILLALRPPLGAIVYWQFAPRRVWRKQTEGALIRQVRFIGNTAFSDIELKRVTGVGQSVRLKMLTPLDSRGKSSRLFTLSKVIRRST